MADSHVQPVADDRRQRSVFVTAVPDPTELSTDIAVVARHLALATLLMFLVGFPAELFNKTLEENYDEVRNWFPRWRRPSPPSSPGRSQGHRFLVYAVVATLLYTVLDPQARVDRATLALLVGLFVAVVATTLALELPVKFYNRRVCGEACLMRTFPGAMVLAVGFVTLSRLAGFEPGYLYGLIAGYVVLGGGKRAARDEGRGVALGAFTLLVLSLTVWLAWIPVNRSVEEGGGFVLLVADAMLVAVFVTGLETLAFGLVPVRFLDGHKLKQWSRPLWFMLQLVAMFGFVHVLLDPKTKRLDTSTDASLVSMFLLFAGFGMLSVSFWAYFRYRRQRPNAALTLGSDGSLG